MSQLMLDDEKAMNDVNPFTEKTNFFPPGTSKQMIDFEKHQPGEDEEEEEYVSPACGVMTMGVGRIGPKEKCALSRPLIPGRNIDTGFTAREKGEMKKCKETPPDQVNMSVLVSITCLILLIAIL